MANTTPATIVDITFAPTTTVARRMRVRIPDEGQLAVWAASGARFQQLGNEWKTQEAALDGLPDDDPAVEAFQAQRRDQATRSLTRALAIIQSALADEHDRDWVEDSLLRGDFSLSDALGILSNTIDVLKETKKQAAPTAGPAKKARRG